MVAAVVYTADGEGGALGGVQITISYNCGTDHLVSGGAFESIGGTIVRWYSR